MILKSLDIHFCLCPLLLDRATKLPLLCEVPNRDRGRPHDLTPPTPPYIRVSYTAIRWGTSTTRAPIETWHAQSVKVVSWYRNRQRRTPAQAPRAMGRLIRVPGQVLTHSALPEFPVPASPPLLPYVAAEAPPDPGVPLLERRLGFGKAKVRVPPVEGLSQGLHDTRK